MERDPFPTVRRIGRWLTRGWPRRLRRLGIALLVVFVALGIPWTYFSVTLGLKLERELQAIRDRGEPLTLEQAAPEMPPLSENAAYVYEQAFRVLQKWPQAPEGAIPGTPLTDLNPPMQDAVAEFVNGDAPDLAPEARAWLFSAEIEARLDAIKRASRMERCVFPVNWEDGFAALLPHLAQFRAAQRLVAARMMIAGREGRSEEALQWCAVGLRMAKHTSADPVLIGLLVRTAMLDTLFQGAQRVCADVSVPPGQAEALLALADDRDLWQHFERAMLGERALGMWVFGRADASRAADLGLPGPGWFWQLYGGPLGGPLRKHDQLQFLDLWSVLLERTGHPWREVGGNDPALEHFLKAGMAGLYIEPITHAFVPSFANAQMKRDAAIARLDQFRIALALNLYRQAHGGYPETLAPLAEVVDWPIPDDIFSGEPFRYWRESAGYVLWSLGPDLDDDGGREYGEIVPPWDDRDIVWRVEG